MASNECGEFDNALKHLAESGLFHLDEIEKSYHELQTPLRDANLSYSVSSYTEKQCSRADHGFLVCFIRKVIRKLTLIFWGWFINPIIADQTRSNAMVVQTLNGYSKLIGQLIHELSAANDELRHTRDSDDDMKIQNVAIVSELKRLTQENEGLKRDLEKNKAQISYMLAKTNVSCDLSLLQGENSAIDYFDFEDKFRGERNKIKASQNYCVPYFRDNHNQVVLDIGCGRGEFLELMFDNGIAARGIDMYPPFADYCRKRGFDVVLTDALTYLDSLEDCSVGGIFMAHMVEHLSNDYIVALIRMAYRKLKPGCCFILETPNPETLATLSNFNIDLSHVKPVHFLTMQYLFADAGFTNIERYDNEFSRYPFKAEHLDIPGAANIDEFNKGVDAVNSLVFGCRDYSLIARK